MRGKQVCEVCESIFQNSDEEGLFSVKKLCKDPKSGITRKRYYDVCAILMGIGAIEQHIDDVENKNKKIYIWQGWKNGIRHLTQMYTAGDIVNGSMAIRHMYGFNEEVYRREKKSMRNYTKHISRVFLFCISTKITKYEDIMEECLAVVDTTRVNVDRRFYDIVRTLQYFGFLITRSRFYFYFGEVIPQKKRAKVESRELRSRTIEESQN